VNNEDNKIIDILQSYILRNKGEKNAHSNDTQAKNKAKRPLQLTEVSEVNINAMDKNQEILEEMTTNSSDKDSYSDEENNILVQVPENVQNLTHVIGRERPPKSCFKSSIEKEQNRRGAAKHSYKCGQCGGVGHNAAYHKLKKKLIMKNNVDICVHRS
ncbi:12277_t:CDS:1, partial [Gigaspora rosea]